MERIIQILMRRDDLTHKEAKEVVQNALDMVYANLDHPSKCEEIWMAETGLEIDYLMEVLL